MNNPETVHVIACPPVSRQIQAVLGITNFKPAAGSQVTECALCHALVWIGPAQLKFKQDKPQAQALCYLCCMASSKGVEMEVASLAPQGHDFNFQKPGNQ
jgi:hypothetical protein